MPHCVTTFETFCDLFGLMFGYIYAKRFWYYSDKDANKILASVWVTQTSRKNNTGTTNKVSEYNITKSKVLIRTNTRRTYSTHWCTRFAWFLCFNLCLWETFFAWDCAIGNWLLDYDFVSAATGRWVAKLIQQNTVWQMDMMILTLVGPEWLKTKRTDCIILLLLSLCSTLTLCFLRPSIYGSHCEQHNTGIFCQSESICKLQPKSI